MVHPFLRRRQGLEPVTYLDPCLKPILAETLGVVVFQEQVIRIAMVMGQFSAGEADLLRRAMSRHRSDGAMAQFRERFVAGAAAQGIAEETAQTMFDKLAGFASYGFCKSHAASFARLAYETLYLRARYPAEYYCALFNAQPMGFYAPRVLAGDARRHGVMILRMDVNRSDGRCSVEGGAIRLGLQYADGLGETGAARVVDARAGGPYRGLTDFCRRTRLPRRVVERLILGGAMDAWGRERRNLIWELGRVQYVEEGFEVEMPDDAPALEPMTEEEAMLQEYGATGLAAGGQMMELYREALAARGVVTSAELERVRNGQMVQVAGLVVVRQSPGTAKGFVFLTLEDETGLINLIVRPDVFQAQKAVWARSLVVLAEGRVQRAHGRVDVLAEQGEAVRG